MLKLKDSKHLVFLIFILSLILLFSTASCNAMDINGTDEVVTSNLENLEVTSQGSSTFMPVGNKFSDIQTAIHNANPGDTIILNQERYVGEGEPIYLYKSVNIIGAEGITPILDAQYMSTSIVIEDGGTNLLIKNCEFINGKFVNGGAITIVGHDITIENCNFKHNEARGGGAICTAYGTDPNEIKGNNVRIIGCNFFDNTATIAAGAVELFGNNSAIINCTFDSNKVFNNEEQSIAYGGAIQIGKRCPNSIAYCINSTFINNKAISAVEGFYSHGGAGCVVEGVIYDNCKFIGNSADYGGALLYHVTGEVNNCLFENNTALKFYGGALCTGNSSSMNVLIKNSEFKGNVAPLGGACYLVGETMDFKNCTFIDNKADENGGAIYIKSKTTSISDSKIIGNEAMNGGALYIDATSVLVENNEFTSNEAIPSTNNLNDGLGGAIYINSSEAVIKNNNFKYNVARNGSALYVDKYAVRTEVINNNMVENQAWVYYLPILAPKNPVLFGEEIRVSSIVYGGNNIGNASNVAVSNAIYNNGWAQFISIDGTNPVLGATNSGALYQDGREFNTKINLKIVHEDGTVVFNQDLFSDVYGEVQAVLNNIPVGIYRVYATHEEDNYYKGISNYTTFEVVAKTDIQINKRAVMPQYNYRDIIVWNITIKNNGPNKATGIVISDMLPNGLVWIQDNSLGAYNPQTGILNLNSLDVGQSKTLIIHTLVNKTGVLTNNANVSSNEYDPDFTNNLDFEQIYVNPSADLAVTETVNVKNPNFGDEVSWIITAINNGPDTANNVNVTSMLPEGLIYISDNGRGAYNPETGEWLFNKLNKGETKTLTIRCIVNKTGKFTNDVSIKADEYDWDMSNNNATEFINVASAADLEISKTVNNSNPNYLDAIKWTITVKNNGPDDATGVKVIENLPDGLVILTINRPDEFSNNQWVVGNLNKGESKELIIYCRVNKTGNFTNVVSVEGNQYDPNNSNDVDSQTISVKPASDLEVIKNVSNKNPNFKDIVIWTIEVKNNGPDIANNVEVTEMLPEGLTFIRSYESKGIYNPTTGKWTIQSLAPFSSHLLKIECRVDKTGSFTNKATVTADELDIDKSNNEATETIIVNKTIDLAIEILVNDSNPDYKKQVLWNLKVSNYGPNDATGVIVSNSIPSGLIWINKGISNYDGENWNVGLLKAGETKSLELICLVDKTGTIVNFATVSGNELELNLENNRDSKSLTVRPAADLEISKQSSKAEYMIGDIIDYQVVVVNNGPDTAHNIIVEDILEPGMSFDLFNADKGSFNEDGRLWTIDELATGQSAVLTFKAIANVVGEVLNQVSVDFDEYDYNAVNNKDLLSVLVKNANEECNITGVSIDAGQNVHKGILKAYENHLEIEKTGSPILILVMSLCVLLSFGYGYYSKK